jgi:AcrR family transcriptional regulator
MQADRRARILDAALEAFAERGYAAATIADVRLRSGASVGSIYHRFGGKEGIAAELYLDCLSRYQRGLVATLRRCRDAEAGIRALVRHHLRWVERNPQRAMFLLERRDAEAAAEDRVRALNHETFAAVRTWLAPHVEAGAIRPMPLELLYAIVLGPCQEHARQRLRGRTKLSLAETERVLAAAAWGAVRGDDRTANGNPTEPEGG